MVFYFTSNGEWVRGERLEALVPAGGGPVCDGPGPAAVRGAPGRAPGRFLRERGRPVTARPPAPTPLSSLLVLPVPFLRAPGVGCKGHGLGRNRLQLKLVLGATRFPELRSLLVVVANSLE